VEEQELVVVSNRVGDADPIPGSAVGSCRECGAHVHLSPATLALTGVPAWEVPALCVQCALPDLAAPGVAIMPPTPEQLREVREAMSD